MTEKHSERIKLESGLDRLGLDVPDSAVDGLLTFMDLLKEWSGTYNLVAPGDLHPVGSQTDVGPNLFVSVIVSHQHPRIP